MVSTAEVGEMGRFEVYNASAGSGKTYALVKNYLRICLATGNSMKFREILAITFTNKAANEMKDRIILQLRIMSGYNEAANKQSSDYQLLNTLSQELDLSPEKLSYRAAAVLSSILHNYSALSVSTIDKFTNRLIRSFAQDLKLSSNYEVELDSSEMLSEAVDRMLADLEENSLTSRILLEFVNTKLDEGKSPRPELNLQSMGHNLFDEGAMPFLKRLRDFDSAKIIEAGKKLKKEQKEIKEALKLLSSQFIKLLELQGIQKMDFSGGYLYNYIQYVHTGVDSKWPPNKTVLKVLDGGAFYAKSKAVELASKFDPIENRLRQLLAEIAEQALAQYPRYHLISKILRDIYSLATLAEIETNLELVKEETNRLPIGEFNKLISQKLDQEPTAYLFEKLGDRYHFFFIDEFQDTSVLQWRNLLPLISNAMASSGQVMIVGDGKQSIYRWRGGEVSQFVDLSNDTDDSNKILVGEKMQELYPRHKVSLESNYRSRRTVVEFNNDFFSTTSDLLEGEQFVKLYKEAPQKVEGQEGGYVHLKQFSYDPDTYDQQQCEACLETIKSAVERGYPLSDITIITRRKQESALLAEYLITQGLGVVSPDSLLIEKSNSVRALVSFIKFLVRPDDHAVRWDFLNHLWKFKIIRKRFEEKHHFLNDLIHKSALELHSFLEQHLQGYSLKKVLEQSLADKVYHMASVMKMPVQSNPFLHTLLDQIIDFQNKNSEGEAGFIRWWDDKGHERSIALPEGNEAVNIMTVHKSKGLEFPITLVPFADWLSTTEPGGSSVWMDVDGFDMQGLPAAKVSLSGDEYAFKEYQILHQKNQENVLLDNLNLAYVAFTRAVDELYIWGSEGKRGDSKNLSRYISKYFLDKGIEENSMSFGELISKSDSKILNPVKKQKLPYYSSGFWMEKVKISIDAPLNWVDGESQQTAYGKTVHYVMSQVVSSENGESVLKNNLSRGTITNEQHEALLPVVKGLTTDPVLNNYYKSGLQVLNEDEILIPGGATARPDRVVLDGDKTHIIDYKTGEAMPKHQEQLNSYRDLLTQMGYPNGDNVLIYLGDKTEVLKW